MDFHLVLETQRLAVIALGVDARPAHRRFKMLHDHGESQRTEETVFGGLHVPEKIRVMRNPGHVGLGKLDAAGGLGFSGPWWGVDFCRLILDRKRGGGGEAGPAASGPA